HTLWRDFDVGRLQISMNEAFFVCRVEAVCDLPCVIERSLKWQWAFERLTFNQLHYQGVILNSIDLGDIRVIERSQHLCFAGETGHPLGILREGLRKDFDGDLAMELRVRRTIDFAHPALAELGGDVIVRDGFADHFFNPASQFTTAFNRGADDWSP